MEKKTKPTENFNVQKRCEEIHFQYGTTEMANYRLQQMCDKIAQDAFDQGRQSIIDNASKLDWEDIGMYGQCGMYLDVCRAHKPLMDYLIRQWYQPKDIELFAFGDIVKNGFKSVEEAKVYADEMYKKEIKKVLGL